MVRRTELTKSAWRDAVANAILAIQSHYGLTDEEVGDEIGCCDQTVSNARNKRNDFSGYYISRAAHRFGAVFLNPILALSNHKALPMHGKGDADRTLPVTLCAVSLRVAQALADDETIDDGELVSMAAEVEAAGRRIDALRDRLHRVQRETV